MNSRPENTSVTSRCRLGRAIPTIGCVDVFCGLGGLTHGLVKGGISVLAGVDLDPACRFPYEANNSATFLERDVRELSARDLLPLYGRHRYKLLAGCAPCQPFSTYGRSTSRPRTDSKWDLVADFGRLIKAVNPDLVTMENVPQLVHHAVFEEFLSDLRGFNTTWEIVECSRYGVPQTRKRLVLLASRLGPISLTSPEAFGDRRRTVRHAIARLPLLEAGATGSRDALHVASSLSPLNLRRIRASKPGGTWRDWSDDLIASCHLRTSGETYPSVYGRMEWDAPAPTITTQCFGYGNGRFGHPEQDRAISLREAAMLQTFPRTYRFVPGGSTVKFSVLGRLIGNAVPVRIGEVIAHSLRRHVADTEAAKEVSATRRHGARRA